MFAGNPLLRHLTNRGSALRVSVLLFSVILAWRIVFWALAEARWEVIPGLRWHLMSLLLLIVWFTPVFSLIMAASWMRQRRQRQTYDLVLTTTIPMPRLTFAYALDSAFRLRWMLVLSPFLIPMSALYPSAQGAEIGVALNLGWLALLWILSHLAAIVVGTTVIMRWGAQWIVWLAAALTTGVAFALTGLLRDSLPVRCPMRIDLAPIPWLPMILLLLLLLSMIFLPRPERQRSVPLEAILGLVGITLVVSASGWLGSVQRQLERQALEALYGQSSEELVALLGADPCHWGGVLCECGRVQRISVQYNYSIETLPPHFGQLYYLRRLDMIYGTLTSISAEIGGLRSLQYLNLRGNAIQELPPEFGRLSSLRVVELTGNELTSLPSTIGQLRSIRRMDVHRNRIAELPPQIGQLDSMVLLLVHYNRLETLPEEIGNLDSLEILTASHNRMVYLPTEISELETLTQLDVSNNVLGDLPDEMTEMEGLVSLYAYENPLTSLPAEVAFIQTLTRIDVRGTSLDTLPASACDFDGLQIEEAAYQALCE